MEMLGCVMDVLLLVLVVIFLMRGIGDDFLGK